LQRLLRRGSDPAAAAILSVIARRLYPSHQTEKKLQGRNTLLTPGLAYVLRRERERPAPPASPFRETAAVALVSLACDAIVLGAFAVLRWLLPRHTPDVGALVRGPKQYLQTHYATTGFWLLGLLAFSCLLAVALASGEVGTWTATTVRRMSWVRWLVPDPDRGPQPVSLWWKLFDSYEDGPIHVGCQLDDGSFVAGWLWSYNHNEPESPDRDLAISAPITFRAAGTETTVTLERVGVVAVSARRIVTLHVSYIAAIGDGMDHSEDDK
jgi:Family of unknown function (DUF6338)